jgi:predicted nucleic acid-binding protein
VPELLFDSDVLIDHLRGARRIDAPKRVAFYSVVTRCELYAGPESHEKAVSELLGSLEQVGISTEVAEAAGRIRRSTGIHTPDALIAATAIANGLTLVTRNARDYGRVKGLRCEAPPT